jgi:hypothetical protein
MPQTPTRWTAPFGNRLGQPTAPVVPQLPNCLGKRWVAQWVVAGGPARTAKRPAELLLDDPLDVVWAPGFVKPREDRPDLRLVLIIWAPGSPESHGVVSEDQRVHFREELGVRLLEAPPLRAAPLNALGNVRRNVAHGRGS